MDGNLTLDISTVRIFVCCKDPEDSDPSRTQSRWIFVKAKERQKALLRILLEIKRELLPNIEVIESSPEDLVVGYRTDPSYFDNAILYLLPPFPLDPDFINPGGSGDVDGLLDVILDKVFIHVDLWNRDLLEDDLTIYGLFTADTLSTTLGITQEDILVTLGRDSLIIPHIPALESESKEVDYEYSDIDSDIDTNSDINSGTDSDTKIGWIGTLEDFFALRDSLEDMDYIGILNLNRDITFKSGIKAVPILESGFRNSLLKRNGSVLDSFDVLYSPESKNRYRKLQRYLFLKSGRPVCDELHEVNWFKTNPTPKEIQGFRLQKIRDFNGLRNSRATVGEPPVSEILSEIKDIVYTKFLMGYSCLVQETREWGTRQLKVKKS